MNVIGFRVRSETDRVNCATLSHSQVRKGGLSPLLVSKNLKLKKKQRGQATLPDLQIGQC